MEAALFGIMSAFGLSASAGLNAYIPLLVVGIIAHYSNWIKLTPPYDLLANPWILILVSLLLIIEMLVDKIPAVNHINDIIQTVFRPAAGAIVFAASAHVMTGINPLLALACGALGGYRFALASRVLQAHPGALYAVDLAGSCVGAILFSLYLIPVFGFFRTSLLAAELNLAPAALAFLACSARAQRE